MFLVVVAVAFVRSHAQKRCRIGKCKSVDEVVEVVCGVDRPKVFLGEHCSEKNEWALV